MTKETKYFIEQVKLAKKLEEKYKQNIKEFDDYFKDSGKIEQSSIIGPFKNDPIRKKHGLFLNPDYVQRAKRRSEFEEYLKTLEIDLNDYKEENEEYW
jgi:hypothetical protein